MICKHCGCTDEQACVGGCSWVLVLNKDVGVCSNCLIKPKQLGKLVESLISDPDVDALELAAVDSDDHAQTWQIFLREKQKRRPTKRRRRNK